MLPVINKHANADANKAVAKFLGKKNKFNYHLVHVEHHFFIFKPGVFNTTKLK